MKMIVTIKVYNNSPISYQVDVTGMKNLMELVNHYMKEKFIDIDISLVTPKVFIGNKECMDLNENINESNYFIGFNHFAYVIFGIVVYNNNFCYINSINNIKKIKKFFNITNDNINIKYSGKNDIYNLTV